MNILGINLNYLFVMCFLAAMYIMYISPWMRAINNFKKDTQLNGHFGIVALGKEFATKDYNKSLHHLRRFLYYYSQSFYNAENVTDKLKHHQYACLKYLRRIPLRLYNDLNLKHAITEAIENINIILENYTFECHDRNDQHYFGQYS